MVARKKRKQSIVWILIFAIILLAILYLAGFFTGLSYSKRIQQETSTDILKLKSNISGIEQEIQYMQLKESFINSITEDVCSKDILNSIGINKELSKFWSLLPKRLEEYEKTNPPTKEYEALKDSYMTTSFKAWIISKDIYNKCENAPVPILYFYSKDCSTCVEQGQTLDDISSQTSKYGVDTRIFTLDANSKNPAIKLAKEYYNITTVPALVIDEKKISGNPISANQIVLEILNTNQKNTTINN